jgi:hypothetical protein
MFITATFGNHIYFLSETFLENLSHFDLILNATMVLERQNQRQMALILSGIISNSLNYSSEGYWCCKCKAMLDDWSVSTILNNIDCT